MHPSRIYIAGPMRGLPEFNYPAFFQAEGYLLDNGYETANPARFHSIETEWRDCIPFDLEQLAQCDAITFLDGWEKSQGARIEALYAIGAGIREVAFPDRLFSRTSMYDVFHEQLTDVAIEPTPAPDKTWHYSAGKPGVDQIPPEMLLALGRVYTYGERKYARDNWKKGTDWHEFYGSALRHLLAFWSGEWDDPESGCEHLAHAIWNCTTLMYYANRGLGRDTRNIDDDFPPKPGELAPALLPNKLPIEVRYEDNPWRHRVPEHGAECPWHALIRDIDTVPVAPKD